MKQNKQSKLDKRRLYSKLKEFWILHPCVLTILTLGVFAALAIALLCIVSIIQQWDLHAAFTSPVAVFVYVIVGLIAFVYIFQRMIFKRW